jgi:hypothetical protein
MLRRIYIGFGEMRILDEMGINYMISSFRTPGRTVHYVDVKLTDEQVTELKSKGVKVW